MREKYVYFQQSPAATLAVNGELTVTAVDKSSKGNLISVTVPESGTESQVTVTVSGNDITCAIGTSNDMGPDDIVSAITASAAASALVTATNSGTTHITSAIGQAYLSGGENGVGFPLSSFAGMHPSDNDSIRIYFKSMRNHDGTTSRADHVVKSDYVQINTVGNDTTGTVLRETMNAICEAFTSARSRPYDIVIGDDRGDGTQYINSTYIDDTSGINIDAANS